MNKVELVGQVSNQTGLTKKASKEAIAAITSVISDTLARGEKVTLVGFGTFQITERKARTGRNPQTGDDLILRSRRVVTFQCSPVLSDKINKKY